MADALFEDLRLAAIYDALDGDRSDLPAYLAIADELDARRVLDVGCGTGTFACLLAERGVTVIAVDPARASLTVAATKPGADRVQWVLGTVDSLPSIQVDLATMTGNVAQVFVDDDEWLATLQAIHRALRPNGRLVFETREPARRAWLEWDRAHSFRRMTIAGAGAVESWVEVIDVVEGIVTFRWTFVFAVDGAVLQSDSTLRFRSRDDVAAALRAAGFRVDDVRDAPDRPGRELVFLAGRSD